MTKTSSYSIQHMHILFLILASLFTTTPSQANEIFRCIVEQMTESFEKGSPTSPESLNRALAKTPSRSFSEEMKRVLPDHVTYEGDLIKSTMVAMLDFEAKAGMSTAELASLFDAFTREITRRSGGFWTAIANLSIDGSYVFRGDFGHYIVFRSDPADKGRTQIYYLYEPQVEINKKNQAWTRRPPPYDRMKHLNP